MNSRSKVTLILAISLNTLGVAACTTIGPHPQIAMVEAEVKDTVAVEKILAAPTTGTGTVEASDDLNKAVPAAAYSRYQGSLIIAPSLEKVLATLHQPKVAPMLLVNWQAAFYQWVKDGEDGDPIPPAGDKDAKIKRRKTEMLIELSEPETAVPKNDKDLKALAKTLKKNLATYHDMQKHIASGQGQDLLDEVGTHKEQLDPTEALLRSLLKRLQITYMLLSHIEGDIESFNKNGPVVLHVALVNTETGKFRYYTRSVGRKSEVPATYTNVVSIMAKNMFDDLSKVDRIDDEAN